MWLQIQYPTASTDEIIARIIGGVDKCLPQGLIASDGVINPQKALNDPAPVIVSARAEDKHVTLDGWFFGADEGTATSTQPYRVLRWSDREIVVQTDIAPENTEDFTVTRADGVASVQRLRFECKSQAWESHAPLPEPLAWSEAVTCGEYIYVIGGTRSDESTSNQLYRYDPASDSWTDCGSITEDAEADYLQYGLSAVCLKDKIVLASYDGLKNENRFFAYHPEDGQWSELQFSSLPPVTCNAALAVYRDELYLVGGIVKDETHEDENSIWRLDEAENAWMKAEQLSGERFDPLAVQVGDALYILGGKQGENVPVNTWEIFDGASTALMDEFPLSGIDKTNAVYAGGKTLFVYTDGNTFSSAGISFDPQSECWSELHEQLGFAERTEICGAALEDKLYFIGGLSDLRMTNQVDAIQISQ